MKKITEKRKIDKYKKILTDYSLIPLSLIDSGNFYEYEKNELLVRLGEELKYFLVILKGKTKISNYTETGKMLTINKFNAPHYIGEIELILDCQARMEVIATTDIISFNIPIHIAREKGFNDNAFLRKLLTVICQKEIDANKKIVKDKGISGKNKLLDLIINNSEDNIFSMKKTEVSELLGLSYRHIEDLFKILIDEGYIKKLNSRKYEILRK